MLTYIFTTFGFYSADYPTNFKLGGQTIGEIISKTMDYIFPLVGIILLLFLASGGFDLMTSAGDAKKMEAGKEKLTSAIVGFIIVFAAYWIYRIIRFMFGID